MPDTVHGFTHVLSCWMLVSAHGASGATSWIGKESHVVELPSVIQSVIFTHGAVPKRWAVGGVESSRRSQALFTCG